MNRQKVFNEQILLAQNLNTEYELHHKLAIYDKNITMEVIQEVVVASKNQTDSLDPKIKINEKSNSTSSCGKPSVDLVTSLIIGGSSLARGEWPW